jgi:hypothetical protein
VSGGALNHDGLAALLPVDDGREEGLRSALQALPGGERSPFGRLESTHFARLVVVPALPGRDDRPVPDIPACLLFAAEFDIPCAGYLEAMCTLMPAEADALFGHCAGYPGARVPPRFASWMLEHRVTAGFSLHGNPAATAGEVVEAVALRERLIAFVVKTRSLGPAELRLRFAQEDWGPT